MIGRSLDPTGVDVKEESEPEDKMLLIKNQNMIPFLYLKLFKQSVFTKKQIAKFSYNQISLC